jgi:hypothetical protein
LPGPDLGALGQIRGGLEASDVDLLTHQQFPQFALGSRINGAYGLSSAPRFMFDSSNSACASDLLVVEPTGAHIGRRRLQVEIAGMELGETLR